MAKAEGAATFPYMKDPNTGVAMTESDDIVEHLFRTYGPVGFQLAGMREQVQGGGAAGAGAEAWVEKQIAAMGAAELGVPYMLQRGVGGSPRHVTRLIVHPRSLS